MPIAPLSQTQSTRLDRRPDHRCPLIKDFVDLAPMEEFLHSIEPMSAAFSKD